MPSVDEDAIAEATNEIIKELDMAIAEHDAMLRYLEMQVLQAKHRRLASRLC